MDDDKSDINWLVPSFSISWFDYEFGSGFLAIAGVQVLGLLILVLATGPLGYYFAAVLISGSVLMSFGFAPYYLEHVRSRIGYKGHFLAVKDRKGNVVLGQGDQVRFGDRVIEIDCVTAQVQTMNIHLLYCDKYTPEDMDCHIRPRLANATRLSEAQEKEVISGPMVITVLIGAWLLAAILGMLVLAN